MTNRDSEPCQWQLRRDVCPLQLLPSSREPKRNPILGIEHGNMPEHKNSWRNRILVLQHLIGGAAGELPPESEKPNRRILQAQLRL